MTRHRDTTTTQGTRFAECESGAALVELAFVLPVFLLLFFGLIDFGRMGAEYVMAEKAIQRAARLAAVRPPACAGVPTFNTRGPVAPGAVPPKFGTKCSAGANICASPAAAICPGNTANATVAEIWNEIGPLMPFTATPANLRFVYQYNSDLGFVGGPYTPVVTVEVQNLNFQFATPLGAIATFAGGNGGALPGSVVFPSMSMSLPGEDLDLGNNG